MRKRILSMCACTFFLPVGVHASLQEVVSLALGSDRVGLALTKNIAFMPPFQNTYTSSSNYDTQMVGGIFFGFENALRQKCSYQLGLSYYQSSLFTSQGNVYQFGDPAFNNLRYNFQIMSRRVLFEGKLLRTFKNLFHPYLTAGIGEAINRSYSYKEDPITTDAVPMAIPFDNHTSRSLTYSAGLGIDIDITKNVRIGASYRYLDLGRARLNQTPLQTNTAKLSYTHLHTNELLMQLTYVG
jgi:opacity protein-like surface antigen